MDLEGYNSDGLRDTKGERITRGFRESKVNSPTRGKPDPNGSPSQIESECFRLKKIDWM